jgi:hypothetical protein
MRKTLEKFVDYLESRSSRRRSAKLHASGVASVPSIVIRMILGACLLFVGLWIMISDVFARGDSGGMGGFTIVSLFGMGIFTVGGTLFSLAKNDYRSRGQVPSHRDGDAPVLGRWLPRAPRSIIKIGILAILGVIFSTSGIGLFVCDIGLGRHLLGQSGPGLMATIGVFCFGAGVCLWSYAKVGWQLRRGRIKQAGRGDPGEQG